MRACFLPFHDCFLVFSLYFLLVLSYFWRFLGRIVCFILRRRSLICLLYLPNPDHPHYFQFLFTLLYPFFLPFSFSISPSFLPRHSKLPSPYAVKLVLLCSSPKILAWSSAGFWVFLQLLAHSAARKICSLQQRSCNLWSKKSSEGAVDS